MIVSFHICKSFVKTRQSDCNISCDILCFFGVSMTFISMLISKSDYDAVMYCGTLLERRYAWFFLASSVVFILLTLISSKNILNRLSVIYRYSSQKIKWYYYFIIITMALHPYMGLMLFCIYGNFNSLPFVSQYVKHMKTLGE